METDYDKLLNEINSILEKIEGVISKNQTSEANETAVSLISLYCGELYNYGAYISEKASDIIALSNKFYSKRRNNQLSGRASEVRALILTHIFGIRSFILAEKNMKNPKK